MPTASPALRKGARHMLEVLAGCHPLALTRAQLATLSGIAVRGGTYGTYYSTLRREGLITEDNKLTSLTTAGLVLTGHAGHSAPVSAEQVRAQWRAALRAGAVRMLDVVIEAHPGPVTRGELAAAAGIEPTGGTFGTYLSQLRRNGLVDVNGDHVTANAVLFLDPASPPAARAS